MKSTLTLGLLFLILFSALVPGIDSARASVPTPQAEQLGALIPLAENGCGTADFPVPAGDALSTAFSAMASELFGTGKLAIWQDACNVHDRCYDSLGASRSRCDDNFQKNMLRACASFYGAGSSLVAKIDPYYYICEANAKVYYEVVRKFGDSPFKKAQANSKKPVSCSSGTAKYRISIYTSNKDGAGTDADMTIRLYGSNGGSSPSWELDTPRINDFERNGIDVFKTREIKDLGSITKVAIGHDNSGDGSGWHLEKITVQNMCLGEKYWIFACNRWLADDEEDEKLQRVITTGSCK